MPACDEVWRLGHLDDPECRFFRLFSEEGHYGGRTEPTDTRQGIYCCAPSGRFLASINTARPEAMRGMLERALTAWKQLPEDQRYLADDPEQARAAIRRSSNAFPEDGLALRVYSRDLPRDHARSDWRNDAWNVDSLWLKADEAKSLLPESLKPGQAKAWPRELAERLVRLHLVDNVRGQTRGFERRHVLTADLRTRVASIDGDVITIALEGTSRTSRTGTWPQNGRYGSLRPAAQQEGELDEEASGERTVPPPLPADARGVQTTLQGQARFDRKRGRFLDFQLAARGTRWGRTRYNSRHDDLDESGIAFAIVFAGDDPAARVAPASFGAYGWR